LIVAATSIAVTQPGGAAARPAPPTGGRASELSSLYAEFWEENLVLNPLQATQIGDPRYNDQLPNSLSAEYRERTREFHQRYLHPRDRQRWSHRCEPALV
jgi:hypothetical protein